MRVIGGRLGGRRLGNVPRGVRPTSDRVRESLFSMLEPLEDDRVLDVCAGSGALGIEALSRGARSLLCIERAGAAVRAIRSNVAALGLQDEVRIVSGDAGRVLGRLAREGERFDLVLFDPPYDAGLEADVLGAIVNGDLLDVGARVVVEGAKRHPLPPVPGLVPVDERVYGDTVLYFFTRAEATQAGVET